MTILDTNVISEMMKGTPSAAVLEWLNSQVRSDLYTTAPSQAEILLGIELLPHGRRRDELEYTAASMFAKLFFERVLPFDSEAAAAFAEIMATRRERGRPMSDFDGQIAAITRVRDAVLATRNTPDFEHCGIKLMNPWQAA